MREHITYKIKNKMNILGKKQNWIEKENRNVLE